MTDINIKYKTGSRRLGAALVDALVFIPLYFVDNYIRTSFDNKFIILLWLAIMTFAGIFYSVFFHFKFGQTLGKMAAGVKVIDLDENKSISLKQSLFRDSFYIIIQIFGLLYFASQILQTVLSTTILLEDYDNFLGQVSILWIGLELISMFTNSKKRAVHDFIAKTVVIRTKV